MKAPRVTTRRLMLAMVALTVMVALTATAYRFWRFRVLAVDHRDRSRVGYSLAFHPGLDPRSTRIREHHLYLAAKYRAAARRPWLPVAPDPPEPE